MNAEATQITYDLGKLGYDFFQYQIGEDVNFYQHAGSPHAAVPIMIQGDPVIRVSLDMKISYDRPNWQVRLDLDDPDTLRSRSESLIRMRFMNEEAAARKRAEVDAQIETIQAIREKLRTCNLLLGSGWLVARARKKEDAARQAVPALVIQFMHHRTESIEDWLKLRRETEIRDIQRLRDEEAFRTNRASDETLSQTVRTLGTEALTEIARLYEEGLLDGSNSLSGLLDIAVRLGAAKTKYKTRK